MVSTRAGLAMLLDVQTNDFSEATNDSYNNYRQAEGWASFNSFHGRRRGQLSSSVFIVLFVGS
jgi:hypothetical protein